jgi:hypothetical protein
MGFYSILALESKKVTTFSVFAVHPEPRLLADGQSQEPKGILVRRRQLDETITDENTAYSEPTSKSATYPSTR